ncbi:hypothetical protein SDC9_72375 [bioreactor metagenome]|uniref:Uncharacterized protein n=1 Tax=bioreactor metagenome TaxID=1076179 RepID=A0A644YBG0_9ZZZZ
MKPLRSFSKVGGQRTKFVAGEVVQLDGQIAVSHAAGRSVQLFYRHNDNQTAHNKNHHREDHDGYQRDGGKQGGQEVQILQNLRSGDVRNRHPVAAGHLFEVQSDCAVTGAEGLKSEYSVRNPLGHLRVEGIVGKL